VAAVTPAAVEIILEEATLSGLSCYCPAAVATETAMAFLAVVVDATMAATTITAVTG